MNLAAKTVELRQASSATKLICLNFIIPQGFRSSMVQQEALMSVTARKGGSNAHPIASAVAVAFALILIASAPMVSCATTVQ
jgi:hypothetical protein